MAGPSVYLPPPTVAACLACRWVHEIRWTCATSAAMSKPPNNSNSVLIPRGLFFESQLYEAFNNTYNASSPFAGATVSGSTNTVGAHVNAQVVQIEIAKNATLAEAVRFLERAHAEPAEKPYIESGLAA